MDIFQSNLFSIYNITCYNITTWHLTCYNQFCNMNNKFYNVNKAQNTYPQDRKFWAKGAVKPVLLVVHSLPQAIKSTLSN